MKTNLLFVILFILTSCRESEISSPSDNDANILYPTTLYKLDKALYDSIKTAFQLTLGTSYYATLDSFGCIGHVGLLSRGPSAITDQSQAVAAAKNALIYLKEYSKISDTSVVVSEATKNSIPPNITDWTISFKNQIYEGFEVWDTQILTIISDNGVMIDGHHYKNIFIPHQNIISKEQAKKNLVGQTFEYQCWTPSSFTITDSTIKIDKIEQCIFPLSVDNKVELRVAWKVPIYPSAASNYPMWYYFVDVLSGATISVKQLFIC